MCFKKIAFFPALALLLPLLFSCDESADGYMDKIIRAQEKLTDENCDEAIDILEDIDSESRDARWHQTMASATACSGSFREISFFVSGIKELNASSLGASLSSLTLSSDMTTRDDTDYTSLLTAVRALKNAGNPDSSDVNFTLDRHRDIWGTQRSTDMILQATYMVIAALGMYMSYYGDANSDGDKGGGSGSNNCYLNYVDTAALLLLGTLGSATTPCTGGGSGHPDLTPSSGGVAGETLTRACEGITLFNMLFAFLASISIPSDSGDLGSVNNTLSPLIAACESAIEAALGSGNEAICRTTSQSECESIGTSDSSRIEYFFLTTFESLHTGS